MKTNKFKKYLEKKYWKENQRLKFKTRANKEKGNYYSQDIECGDYSFCEIQTFDCLYQSAVGTTPYCYIASWGGYIITVPKFGELTDEDVEKAIAYCLSLINMFGIWNIELDGKLINGMIFHDYALESDYLRQWKENLKRSNDD